MVVTSSLLSVPMESVWHTEFDRLFSTFYPHSWFLAPTPMCPSPNWELYQDAAKVRFLCQECGHGWTSMKGRVVFWFNLSPITLEGFTCFKLFGQQCQKCKNGRFEHAMWYPEEVHKVLYNVYSRVGQTYYGFFRPLFFRERRTGKPRSQHPSELCQACQLGVCANGTLKQRSRTVSDQCEP